MNPPTKFETALEQAKCVAEREARDRAWAREQESCRCHRPRVRHYLKQKWCDLCSGWRQERRR